MTENKKYRGIFPAFYTCYDNDGNVSPEKIAKLTEFLIGKGVSGLYVDGSSGECIFQSVEERKLVIKSVIDAAKGRIKIIAHVGGFNTKDSCELARFAEESGADAISAIPPIYYKLPEEAVAEYWNAISAAAPDTDFIIYNIPQLASVTLTPSLLDKMLDNPKVVGVKNSSMPVQDIQLFKRQAELRGRDIAVFNGPDEQFIGGRMMGADAGIGGTYGIMPELFVRLNELFENKDYDKARELQYAVDEIIYTLCTVKGHVYAAVKAVLTKRMGVDLGGVRAPLMNLEESDGKIIDRVIEMINEASGI